jgi:hypothetical protein
MNEPFRRIVRRGLALLVALSVATAPGCAGRGRATVAWFPVRPPAEGEPREVTQAAPESAVYKVRFATRADAAPDDFHAYGGARRVLRRGDAVGFAHGPDGLVYAIAGDEAFPLRPRAGGKRTPAYLVWSYRPADHRSNHLGEFGQGLLDTGKLILIGAAIVGLVALWLWAEFHDDDDCCRNR